MIHIKTEKDIEILREAGKRHSEILKRVAEKVKPGIRTKELDEFAEKLVREKGDIPAFLNYRPEKKTDLYPASLCVSVNEEVVHGIPGDRILKEGDIVSIDLGLTHRGLITDSAMTVPVGKISPELEELISHTKKALSIGIEECVEGNHVGDIGAAIEKFNDGKYGIIRELAGHGVGYKVHEDPFIPNYGKKGTGAKLKAGMVLALEPMFSIGGESIVFHDDGYTVSMEDESFSAHFEHTILITEGKVEILTK